jgi:hypothetical protein
MGKSRRGRAVLGAGLLCLAAACVGPNHPPVPGLLTAASEPVIGKNYVLGVEKTVAVGEAIASATYRLKVSRYPSSILLTQAITVQTEKRLLKLPNGRVLTYVGPVELDHVQYISYGNIEVDDGLGEYFYITPDQALAPIVYIKDKQVFPTGMERIVSTWPASVTFPAARVTEQWLPAGRADHDILFGGKDAGGIHVICQEHAPDGSVDPERVRRLTFPPDAQELQCLGTRIRVQACTATTLVATVIED